MFMIWYVLLEGFKMGQTFMLFQKYWIIFSDPETWNYTFIVLTYTINQLPLVTTRLIIWFPKRGTQKGVSPFVEGETPPAQKSCTRGELPLWKESFPYAKGKLPPCAGEFPLQKGSFPFSQKGCETVDICI